MAGDAVALPEIMEGVTVTAETGSQSGAPAVVAVLAEAQPAAGQLAEAQGTIATGIAIAAETGQFFCDADLHRLDGDLLLATGGPADEAAARYHRALAIAREQGARSFELRARRASRASGAIRASAPKRATSSRRSTAGSPKASTRAT
jgi:hypothetical protein